MRVLGLTGGIATGKSSVARILANTFGLPVVDADQLARAVVQPGGPCLEPIVAHFGPGVLQEDGTLDRSALRTRIMTSPEDRRTLEAITHPAIFAAMRSRIAELEAEGHTTAVVEAALMVETGSYKLYPTLLVVSCRPETQVRRVMARDGVDETEARQTLAAQLPLADKEAVATHVIRNDGTPEELRAAVIRVASLLDLEVAP
jgi:dephospho-CoA kinase